MRPLHRLKAALARGVPLVSALAFAACTSKGVASVPVADPGASPEAGAADAGGDGARPLDAGADAAADDGASPGLPPLSALGHIVVIYLENHSFDNLYGSYPGAEGLASPAARILQIDDATGQPFPTLPQVDPALPPGLPNAPFDITAFLPPDQRTVDLVHRFYHEQLQINGGRMDRFVTISDALGLTMGFYPTGALPLPRKLATVQSQVAVCDHFFHAAFGGSFLNHMWLVAAATPVFAAAPASMRPTFDAEGRQLTDGDVTPDGYAVNTVYSVNSPHPDVSPELLLPPQTMPTIGDRLSDAGVSWAWYSGGFDDALAGNASDQFQFHHQPFVYFARFADGTSARTEHLKDEKDFVAAVTAGELPAVSFVKPVGLRSEHPGWTDLATGERHVVDLVEMLMASPAYRDMVIIVTYDENGGFFDHVPPPVVDRWGPGARVPTILISPFAKGGVDATPYDTTAILALIETRFRLAPLSARDAAQADLSTHALSFR